MGEHPLSEREVVGSNPTGGFFSNACRAAVLSNNAFCLPGRLQGKLKPARGSSNLFFRKHVRVREVRDKASKNTAPRILGFVFSKARPPSILNFILAFYPPSPGFNVAKCWLVRFLFLFFAPPRQGRLNIEQGGPGDRPRLEAFLPIVLRVSA